jgi:hypothetical protein
MATPSYTTDLSAQVISECESNATPLVFTNLGTGSDATETDYFIQKTACVSKPFNITAGGIYCTTSQAITSSQLFWAWYYFGCPNKLLGETSGGLQALVGQSGTAHDKWDVLGSDTYTYGGWRCIPVDFLNVGYDDRTGAGAGTSQFLVFGVYCNTSGGIGKGNPLGIDVMRYGRGEARINGGETGNYATFTGFATENDDLNNRWGLIQAVDGGYLQQGLVILGYASAVDFRDSNKYIVIANTKKVLSSFNRWEVRQAGSRVDWTNISISSLGTVARGEFECIDNADINFDSCVFTDMSTFVFQSASTILNTTFRRCGVVTQGGAVFANCIFDNSREVKAILVNSISNLSNCFFISSGTGYAIEGFGTAGDYTISDVTFTNYASGNGTSGNEAIHVLASSGIVNINIDGGTTPSIHTEGATVNVIIPEVILTLTGLQVESDISIITSGTTTERTNVQENPGTTYPYNYSYAIGDYVDIGVFKGGYVPFYIRNYLLGNTSSSLPISQVIDRAYLV